MPLTRFAARTLRSATTNIDIAAATAPSSGQVLTATGTTAATWQTPSGGGATCLAVIPLPAVNSLAGNSTNGTYNTNTTQYFYQFALPFGITVNKVSIYGGGATVLGTYDITIYSENGQTQEIAVTTANVDVGITTTAVSAVALSAGMHWFGFNSNGTANVQVANWAQGATTNAFSTTNGLPFAVTSEPVMCGTATITASTPKANFNPVTDLTINSLSVAAPVFRLDN